MAERYWVQLERDVVTVDGPEAEAFLQGQLSQDVTSIGAGGHAWSWLLAPTGKVDALVRVGRLPSGTWTLDTDAGWGEPARARLDRFKLRTKVDIASAPDAEVTGLRGDGWDVSAFGAAASLMASPPWPGIAGADLMFLDGTRPAGLPDDAKRVTGDYEAARVAAGIPRMGAELDEKTIPAETGLIPLTVDFAKGCYTGQELVARIDSRGGNVPRHLRRLRPDGPIEPGTELLDGEKVAGIVTSAAYTEALGWVGLGYVKRGYEPPVQLVAAGGGVAVGVT